MKQGKLTLLSISLFVALIAGALIINATGVKPLKLKVKWKPVEYPLDGPPADPWNAEIYFSPPRDLSEIDPSTLLLEGMYTPTADPYMATAKPRLVVPFNGNDVVAAVMAKAPHMAPGTEMRIWLEITGALYDGTTFAGEGGINVIVPETPPP